MKSLCLSLVVLCLFGSSVFADIIITAVESCRTSVDTTDPADDPNANDHNSKKLSIRNSDEKSAKSWIKFYLGELDVGNLEKATLTVASNRTKAGNHHFDVSYVNDDCLDNIGWDERSLTWNNAPGNDTADHGGLDTTKTTFLTTVNYTDVVAGDSFTIDVLEALEADTDGIVQFVFHNSNNLQDLATHDHDEVTWRPFLDATELAKGQAKKPYPAKDATDVSLTPVLSWTPGEYATMHDVYFGTVFDDVNDASRTDPRDLLISQGQIADSYTPPQRLDFDTTYYWRVDEVNGPPDYTVFKSDVWQFTTELLAYPIANGLITATADSNDTDQDQEPENTVNLSGDLHSTDISAMWLSAPGAAQPNWIQYEFDKVRKLHQMWVWNYNGISILTGFGVREAKIEYSTDDITYETLGGSGNTYEFAKATSADDYAHDDYSSSPSGNNEIAFGGVAAKYVRITANTNWSGALYEQYGLSEVRFFFIPVLAREPNPDSGTTDMDVDNVTLSWRAGREAASHDVYLSTDEQSVIDGTAPVVSVSETSYDTGELQLNQNYYWKIVEVNEAETPTTWEGDVLNFTTREFLVVDDFEDYNNFSPHRVFQRWIDGIGFTEPTPGNPGNGTGAALGHDIWSYDSPHYDGDIMETAILHSGAQSAPLYYDNSIAPFTSEIVRTFDVPQDWTKHGIKSLTLYFYGDPNNVAQQMYVKLNGVKVLYDGDAANITRIPWQPWNIELADLVGVDLSNVTELSIGFERIGAIGGKGVVYFDDIRLYPALVEE